MTRILVVDDEPDLEELVKQKFRKKVNDGHYKFLFAGNGQQALDLLDKVGDVDLVLTDINMPGMDGLTLLSKLNERNSILKTVIVSAYADIGNIRTAMNLGAFDFITKPIDFQDMEITMVKTIKHILQLKENEETLKENDSLKIYLNEIQAQKKLKDKFFAIISHDLRGPVASFQGLADVLSMYIDSGNYQEVEATLSEVKQSTTQLSRLLDNLLNWASQELSAIPYNPTSIDVVRMFEDLSEMFHSTCLSKQITIQIDAQPEVAVYADFNSTITIFRNLIHNALKFTPQNGKISLQASLDTNTVQLKVSDTGVGIPRDKLDHLFVMSDKSSTYGTNGEKGFGLGLQLVNEFVKLNKGNLEVSSKEGEGTTFIVTLPIGS